MKGTLRLFLTLCMAVLSMTLVQAQERTYSGVVKGSDGQPIIGASVEVVGTTVGTSTGLDGDYTIKAKQGSKIKYSFLGTKSVTATAGASTTINVTLEDDAQSLEDVVVVAYGTAKKKDLTGSISSIDSKLISSQANSTLSKALEGSIPGIQVSSVDGQPGQDMAIRIRGIGTANQNNSNPLIVVDGVPYSDQNKNILSTINPKDVESISVLKDAASTSLYGSRGANGVVVVTTKKGQQGKAKITFEGKWGINMCGQSGYPDLIDDPQSIYEWAWRSIYNSARYASNDLYTTNVQNPNMSHEEAAKFASQHLFNYTGSTTDFSSKNDLGNYLLYKVPGLTDAGNLTTTGTGTAASSTMNNTFLVGTDGKLNPNAQLLYYDNWRDYFLQNKFRQEYNISVSGATDKTDYYISGGYLEDPSYIMGSKFNRYNIRSNINTQVTKWLRAGINMSYSRRAMQSPGTRWGRNPGDTNENIFIWFNDDNMLAPIWRYNENGEVLRDDAGNKLVNDRTGVVYSPLGQTAPPMANQYDPIKIAHDNINESIYNDINMNGYLEAKFLKDFTFRTSLAVDETYMMKSRYFNKETGRYRTSGGGFARNYWDYMNINALQTLNWSHDYGKHHVDALLGHEFNWTRSSSLNYVSSMSLIPNFNTFANFIALNTSAAAQASLGSNGGGEDQIALEGYFLRANYNYDSRYFVSASVRTDGSSKFKNVSDRWGWFWSLGGAWRISNEEWIKDASWLTDLKLRADYGTTGNQSGIGNYAGYTTWGYAATGWLNSGASMPSGWKLTQNAMANSSLTWETKKTWDVGLDFRLWDRFYGTIDWYRSMTDDMLWNVPMSIEKGQTTIAANSAKMKTWGIEFDLGVDIIKTPDILWSFSVNGGHYKSTMANTPEGVGDPKLNNCWTATSDAWSMSGVGGGAGIIYLRGEGKPYYNIYQVRYMGVDQTTGLPLYSHYVTAAEATAGTFGSAKEGDLVGTTNYSIADRVELGDATPDFIGGFSTSFTYKNFDIAATFAFQIGGKFFSADYGYDGWYNNQKIGKPVSADMKNNTWSPAGANANATYTNTGAKFPMQIYANPNGASWPASGIAWGSSWQYTDMSLFNASYLSVKNITVGYNFPQRWMDKIGIGGIRVYASLDNMWLITSQSGIDPRMDITGGWAVGRGTYPYMKTCSLGVNVTF